MITFDVTDTPFDFTQSENVISLPQAPAETSRGTRLQEIPSRRRTVYMCCIQLLTALMIAWTFWGAYMWVIIVAIVGAASSLFGISQYKNRRSALKNTCCCNADVVPRVLGYMNIAVLIMSLVGVMSSVFGIIHFSNFQRIVAMICLGSLVVMIIVSGVLIWFFGNLRDEVAERVVFGNDVVGPPFLHEGQPPRERRRTQSLRSMPLYTGHIVEGAVVAESAMDPTPGGPEDGTPTPAIEMPHAVPEPAGPAVIGLPAAPARRFSSSLLMQQRGHPQINPAPKHSGIKSFRRQSRTTAMPPFASGAAYVGSPTMIVFSPTEEPNH